MPQPDIKAQILKRLDIFSFYQKRLPTLKVGSNGEAWALCCFHHETNPSFSVNLTTGLFHCFGCKAGGSPIDFHMACEKCDFQTALADLAQEHGVDYRLPKGKQTNLKIVPNYSLVSKVDFLSEYQKLGLQKRADAPTKQGLLPVSPLYGQQNIAFIILEEKIENLRGRLGGYLEFAPDGSGPKLYRSFFEVMAEKGPFVTPHDAKIHFARQAGTEPTAIYDYVDEEGKLVYQVLKYAPPGQKKDFKQRRPNGQGGWVWTIKDIPRLPYRLPEVVGSQTVFIAEGEKDCDNLVSQGLVATCNSGGAGNWPQEINQYFGGKNVIILPDNDQAGANHALDVAWALHGIAASIKIIDLPDLPEKGDVSDWLAAGGTREQLLDLVAWAPDWDPAESSLLPQIVVTNRSLSDLAAESLKALLAANHPPAIFVRAGALVRVVFDEKDIPKIATHNETSFRGTLARVADYQKETDKGRLPTYPPISVVKDILSLGEWPAIPPLRGITESPVIRQDGTILAEPGYDPPTKLFYANPPDLSVPPISDDPIQEEVDEAKSYLEEIICDFPFREDDDGQRGEANVPANRANALALMLTPVLRPAIPGPIPMALINAPTPGTGKTLFTDVVSIIATGKPAPVAGIPRDDDEMRKFLTSTLLCGNPLGVFDNIDHPIWAPSLCRILTCGEWEDRILGKSETVRLPHLTVWIANGNNLKLRGDLPRRCYPIDFDTGMAKPWERTKFKHPRLKDWVSRYRGDFIAAILTIARAWFVADCPKPKNLPVMGGFEDWAEIVGGILNFIGVQGFLGNLAPFHDQADLEGPEWEGFLNAWIEHVGVAPKTCQEVAGILREKSEFAATLPENLGDVLKDESKSFERSLGRALNRKENRPYGEKNLAFKKDGTTRKGIIRWKIISRA